jgi:protein-S-isoprenylcysteine O-methyltransferase Ste14
MSKQQSLDSPNRFLSSAGIGRASDWIERSFVIGLYGWLVARLVASYLDTGNAVNLILLASEGLVVLFILIRRPAQSFSLRPADWLLAMAATVLPLLVRPGEVGGSLVAPYAAAALMLAGLIVQVCGKLALGRSFGCVPAHRGLILGGPYRFVRHPIYAGYLAGHVAFWLMNPTLWNLGVYALAYVMQIPRLLAEERLLAHDARYRSYMAAVRYRLLPGLF